MATSKKIPVTIAKAKIVQMYHPMSERFIRSELNRIILENRKTIETFKGRTDAELINTHYILKAEFIAFANIYGFPDEYDNTENS